MPLFLGKEYEHNTRRSCQDSGFQYTPEYTHVVCGQYTPGVGSQTREGIIPLSVMMSCLTLCFSREGVQPDSYKSHNYNFLLLLFLLAITSLLNSFHQGSTNSAKSMLIDEGFMIPTPNPHVSGLR